MAEAGKISRPVRPARVVVFTSGPDLELGVRRFLAMLEENPDIDLRACVVQAKVRTRFQAYRALWRRRGLLAIPILLSQWLQNAWRWIKVRSEEERLNSTLISLSPRLWLVEDIHAPQVLDFVHSLQVDLGLIYGSPILKPALFEIPRLGTLGIHHGKIPEYRGKKTMFWAMYNGERSAGVTIQKINAGLDSGQIVQQGEVQIGLRLPGAVWKDLDQLGRELYLRAIFEVFNGQARMRPGQGPVSRIYRDPGFKDIVEFWRRLALRWIARALRPASQK